MKKITKTLEELRQILKTPSHPPETFQPFENIREISSYNDTLGKKALVEGKVGCILVAGGQGTRLGFNGPKGCFPVTPVTNQTLFQYFVEKLKAASALYKKPLKMAIMTSKDNHEAILQFFKSHAFFGCPPSQVSFFMQGELPMLKEDESLFSTGPDGNGSAIESFFNSGVGDAWIKEGIEYVTFILVDNPLADPFDPALITAHLQEKVEASIKCIKRTDLEEKLGVLIAGPAVLEYTEVPRQDWELKEKGEFVYGAGNISLFCFSMPFLKRASCEDLPLHPALKKVNGVNVWKFEKFIFDILHYSQSSQALLYPREMTFSPLKNQTGKHSLENVQKDLSFKDRKILEAITGTQAPPQVKEINPAFHYPDSNLLAKWKGKSIPSSPYVEC